MRERRFAFLSVLRGPTACWLLAIAGMCFCLAGCVQRRLMVRSNPPGALLYIDDYPIGTTPIATNFTYYGTRKIRLVKDGYETLTVMEPIYAPWYEIPPLDFFSENLVPGDIRDRRTLTYQLRPQMIVPSNQLLARAQQLRGQGQATGVVMPPPAVPQVIPIPPPMAPQGMQPPEVVPTPSPMQPVPPGTGGQPLYPLPGPRP